VIFGSECGRDVGRYAARDRVKQAMILTDPGVVQTGLLEPVRASLAGSDVRFEVIDHVPREVPHTAVADIAARCEQARVELLVAVGGGSVIDAAKAVGILLTNGGAIQDYEGVDRVSHPITLLYVVPTTAGNGSDTSQFCIVLDAARKKKLEIYSRKLLPERIFIDPMMTCSMPPDLTAASGMEALSNAIEAYCSTWASPLTDSLALDAIRLISENLRAAVANGQHVEARTNMALAAFEAGLAFTTAQSGAVHALGHSLSGRFDIPERIGDAILLPHVMKANLNADMPRMARVAEVMGEPIAGLSVRAAAQQAIEAVKQLLVDVGLPTSLGTVGADKNAISAMSEQAFEDTFMRTNPRALKREDIEVIYEDAFAEYADEDFAQGRGARVTTH
jgi:alcohol dehydrogenase